VSFVSAHDTAPGLTYTVISNTADGAWPVQKSFSGCVSPPEHRPEPPLDAGRIDFQPHNVPNGVTDRKCLLALDR
jgi:hypothetical protein